MTNTLILSLSFMTFCWSFVNAVEPPSDAKGDSFTDVLLPIFTQHCVKCHGKNESAEADVDLFALKSSLDLTSRAELLDDLITAIDSGSMPPENERPPRNKF